MIEALDKVMPTFDPDITKIASRNLIDKRDIETRAGVFATKVKPGCPVEVELTDAKSREVIEELQVDAVLVATGRVPSTENLKGILRQRPHQIESQAVLRPLITYHHNKQNRLMHPVLKSVRGTFEERGDMVEHSHLRFRGATYLLVRQFDESSNQAMILGTERNSTHLKELMQLLELEVW